MSQIYSVLASISKRRSANFRGLTVLSNDAMVKMSIQDNFGLFTYLLVYYDNLANNIDPGPKEKSDLG